jgi:NADH:ubiquinone oxidoreductase subunit 3 (subunit A)
MWIDYITSLPFIVLLSLAVASLIYWIGGRMAEASSPDAGKAILYASGEEPPHVAPHFDLERYVIYVIYFFIFDILAFILGTSFEHTGGSTVLYAFTILTTVVFLVPHGRRKRLIE